MNNKDTSAAPGGGGAGHDGSLPRACEPLHTKKRSRASFFYLANVAKQKGLFSHRSLSHVQGAEKSDDSIERNLADNGIRAVNIMGGAFYKTKG